MIVTIKLAAALLCFADQCYPSLVGKDTPVGRFTLSRRLVRTKGFGGDVLMFSQDEKGIYAIHRLWNEIPSERRFQRLASDRVSDRRFVTKGCVNIDPKVYDRLVNCCSSATLVITP